jgi:hypothetical protein
MGICSLATNHTRADGETPFHLPAEFILNDILETFELIKTIPCEALQRWVLYEKFLGQKRFIHVLSY